MKYTKRFQTQMEWHMEHTFRDECRTCGGCRPCGDCVCIERQRQVCPACSGKGWLL